MFPWPSLHERMCRTWGSNSGPLSCQADTLRIELPCSVHASLILTSSHTSEDMFSRDVTHLFWFAWLFYWDPKKFCTLLMLYFVKATFQIWITCSTWLWHCLKIFSNVLIGYYLCKWVQWSVSHFLGTFTEKIVYFPRWANYNTKQLFISL